MRTQDNTGATVQQLFRLYQDASLTNKQLRKLTRELLIEHANSKLEEQRRKVESLQKDAEDLRTIKRLLK